MPNAGKILFPLAIGLLSLVFLFELYLAVYVSMLALALFALALIILLPFTQNLLARLPLIRRRGLQQGLAAAIAVAAIALIRQLDVAPQAPLEPTAYVGATIITGEPGSPAIEAGVVLVDGKGKIHAVGQQQAISIPQDYNVIDISGQFLVPGLINAHDHLMMFGERDPFEPADFSGYVVEEGSSFGEWFIRSYVGNRVITALMEKNAKSALLGGVTTARQLATVDFLDVALRDRIERGERIGPRILAAGEPLCIVGGHGHQIGRIIKHPYDARNAVREAIARHVDVIKITSTGGVSDSRRIGEAGELQMTPEEMRAIVDEAHRKNILVTAHAESSKGVVEALRAGVDNIEHGASLTAEAIALFKDNPRSLRGYSTLHPTLSVLAGGVVASNPSDNPIVEVINANARIVHEELVRGFLDGLTHGVHIGVGTDSGVISHDSVWKEMKLFIDLGDVSNVQAISMATLGTAQSIGLDKITGSIAAGKSADMLALQADPRVDIAAFDAPALVVARGRPHWLENLR